MVRVGPEVYDQLHQACSLLKRSQSQVVEEALGEFLKNHGLDARMQLSVVHGNAVLLRVQGPKITVIDSKVMNGVPPKELAERYAVQYRMPVQVQDEPSAGKEETDAPR